MASTWLSKYGYGGSPSPTTGAQPSANSPSWISKYSVPTPTPTVSPAFQNAEKNKNVPLAPSPAFQNAQNIQNMQASMVSNQQIAQPQSFMDKVKYATAEVGKKLREIPTVKDIYNTAKELPGKAQQYAKDTYDNPFDAAAGAGKNLVSSFGSLAALEQKGLVWALNKKFNLNIKVPDRLNLEKQTEAFNDMNRDIVSKLPQEKQRAFQTGEVIGSIIPYALGGEIVGATVGAKMLQPLASKFLPSAVKYIPAINDAIATVGVGQIIHDEKEHGTRIQQFKNDLTIFGLFKVGMFGLGKGTNLLTGGTKKAISEVVDTYGSKFRSGKKVIVDEAEEAIEKVKAQIIQDTGKSPEALIAADIMDSTSKPPKIAKQFKGTNTVYEAQTGKNGTLALNPKENIISPNGTQKVTDKTQVPQEAKAGISQSNQIQNGQNAQIKPKTPQIEGEVKTSKLGLRVEQTAIEKKLTKELGELPQYKTMNMKEQANKAATLINSDPEKAFRVAMGQELPPQGLTKESVFKAVEGSITTPEDAVRLANSPLVGEASELGQRIKSLDVKTSESPVESIRQVINSRTKAIEGKAGSVEKAINKTTEEIKKKVKIPNKYDWNSFIESIKC